MGRLHGMSMKKGEKPLKPRWTSRTVTKNRTPIPPDFLLGTTPQNPKALRAYMQDSKSCSFLGMPISQWHSDLWLWEKFFATYPIKTFIELGTGRGGFSMYFLLNAIQRGFTFDTFDAVVPLNINDPISKLLKFRTHFHLGDINGKQSSTIFNLLKEAPHPIMLYCDNGDKVHEVQTYSMYLLPKDYVAVHDWNKAFRLIDIPLHLEQIFTKEADAMGSYSRWMVMKCLQTQ